MRSSIRHFIVLAVIAVLAFGSSLSFAAPDAADHNSASHHQEMHAAVGDAHDVNPGHDHAHGSSHGTLVKGDLTSEHCIGADCDDSEHANHPCCHTHAHCCTSLITLAHDAADAQPMLGKGALLIADRASVPLGTISYPLLRPPRLSA
jgi:hypothetical protein